MLITFKRKAMAIFGGVATALVLGASASAVVATAGPALALDNGQSVAVKTNAAAFTITGTNQNGDQVGTPCFVNTGPQYPSGYDTTSGDTNPPWYFVGTVNVNYYGTQDCHQFLGVDILQVPQSQGPPGMNCPSDYGFSDGSFVCTEHNF